MSEYYKLAKKIYIKNSSQPFEISRSKIDLFLNCPRCFYFDRRFGVMRPPGYPFALNSAVDALLKKEFDLHRAQNTKHPLMNQYKINAVPFEHPDLNKWRANFTGIRYHHQSTNFIIFGAIDDIWKNDDGSFSIVDYKATSKAGEINLDAEWQIGYKRQMEIYQWLFRQNDHRVSNTGYFVYCNGKKDAVAFDAKLEFDVYLLPYVGDDSWVEGTLQAIKKCLDLDIIPPASIDCDFCQYRKFIKNKLAQKV